MNFSVVLIAKNEEKTLPKMLKSLEEFKSKGGEVCLLDTGSTDKTAQIARDWGCKVEEVGDKYRRTIDDETAKAINEMFIVEGEQPVINAGDSLFDYSSSRNYAATMASNDWVWMPDCDEAFTNLNLDVVQQAISDPDANRLEYNFVFSHDQFGNPMIKFMHSKMYRRDRLHWVGIIHEILAPLSPQNGGKPIFIEEKDVLLEHYQNQETNRTGYLKGLALDCYLNPLNDRNSHYFGRELMYCGRPLSAIDELERHIAMGQWPAERGQSYNYISECLFALGKEDEAIEALHKGYAAEPKRRESLIRLAEYYWRKDNFAAAAAYANASLALPPGNYYSDNASHYRERPHEILYWALWYLGDKEGSKYHHAKCLEYCPQNAKFIEDAKFYA